MKLLIASDPYGNKAAIQDQLVAADIQSSDVTYVESGKAFLDALIADTYDAILAEYAINGMDIWRLSTVINSVHFRAHSCPVFLIKETCEIEIPSILAKEYDLSVVSQTDIGDVLEIVRHPKQDGGYQYPTKNSVLILEDDEDSAFTAYHALKENYDIDTADDGLSGYERWKKKRHDLVLLDLMLPKMSGEQVLKKMMAVNKNQSVIIVTALDKPSIQNRLMLNGASEYLCKPFSLEALRSLCQILLNKSKLLYQAHFAEAKLNAIRDLVWLLDWAITHNESEKVGAIMHSLKDLLPDNLTEDEKINLLAREL